MVRGWRRLVHNPADRNDNNQLELLRAWEPLDSSRALPLGEAKETQNGFLDGNQVTWRKNGAHST
jgi:hypothetical protein